MAAIMIEERAISERPIKIRPMQSHEDDYSVKLSTDTLRRELENLHNRFDQATEPVIIDSLIYEMQAVQMRYMYYLEVCKERGLVSDEFSFANNNKKARRR